MPKKLFKPGNKGTPRPRTKQRSGYWAAKRALSKFGEALIDGRTELSHELQNLHAELVNELGGPDAITKQKEILLRMTIRTYLITEALDSYILGLAHLVHRKKQALWPVVRERIGVADSLQRQLMALGLERVAKPLPSLADVLRQHDEKKTALNATTPNAEAQAAAGSTDASESSESSATPTRTPPAAQESHPDHAGDGAKTDCSQPGDVVDAEYEEINEPGSP